MERRASGRHVDKERVRLLSRFFSTAVLKALLDRKSRVHVIAKMKKFSIHFGSDEESIDVRDFFSRGFSCLRESYQTEIVYKEAILNWWINRSGGRVAPGVLFEVRAGVSKLDALCVGLSSSAFEIKTDYDAPRRLDTQIPSYRARFPSVWVVASEKRVDRAYGVLRGVGLAALTNRGALKIIREPSVDYDRLQVPALISVLRKSEILNLSEALGLDASKIPNTRLFHEVVSVASQRDVKVVSRLVSKELTERTSQLSLDNLRMVPIGLRSLVVGADLSDKDFSTLDGVLNESIYGV